MSKWTSWTWLFLETWEFAWWKPQTMMFIFKSKSNGKKTRCSLSTILKTSISWSFKEIICRLFSSFSMILMLKKSNWMRQKLSRKLNKRLNKLRLWKIKAVELLKQKIKNIWLSLDLKQRPHRFWRRLKLTKFNRILSQILRPKLLEKMLNLDLRLPNLSQLLLLKKLKLSLQMPITWNHKESINKS